MAALPKRIFLVGPRGSGKTTVGRLLATPIGFRHFDADGFLQQNARMSIREIFEKEGEVGFRLREREVLEQLAEVRYSVIATGGGAVLLKENRDLMKTKGSVVWLTADAETLWARISADTASAQQRPNLGMGGREEVRQILAWREPLYRALADHIVDTANRSPEEVADDILVWLRRS